MKMKMKKICVFCGAREGRSPSYRNATVELGKLLAQRKITLVYGGGKVGLMGILADAVLEEGGEVIGVIPEFLVSEEIAHEGTDLRIVSSMHERKKLMAELADGFIALPGGLGTLEEFCEILTWGKLGLHRKPCGILNVDGYFQALLDFFHYMNMEGFLSAEYLNLWEVSHDPADLLERLEKYQSPLVSRIMDLHQT